MAELSAIILSENNGVSAFLPPVACSQHPESSVKTLNLKDKAFQLALSFFLTFYKRVARTRSC
ncbi:hypothetical protein SAMN02746073_2141 [Legionella jamestowniensis DSM 19215]|uniref:Uncharacterized protein n=1 Tax=Legionella jamestowniensis TaxID=455 RepID=A0A0W0UG23_9GAMM|nr:hypothetical protein Ljam_0971 [Legionella jamestowniensis]SFL83445.1 hypothetical protein SAMN02746073_2141 [Legionella jamestowniensis DSM 19215]